jgi:predicted outer membrane protein
MTNDQSPKVGYKNPPKHTQFQKGRSGNPRGRPKKKVVEHFAGDRQLRDDFLSLALQDIKVTLNGKQVTMPAIHGIHQKQIAKALAGDTRAAEFCDSRYARYMVDQGNATAKLFETYLTIDQRYKDAIATEPSLTRLAELKKKYEEFKKADEVKEVFELMETPIKKFKP